jgi:shikimate kinase
LENSKKIFLLGFMGSGKTTVGKKLANKLNRSFFDLDAEIEKEKGSKIEDIFTSRGEDYFRKVEKELLNRYCNKEEGFVLALGGGTPCFFNNMDVINEVGTSIYIKYNSGILTSRLLNANTVRPLVAGKNEEELRRFIEKMLQQREPFYAQSKFTFEKNNIRLEDILELIKNL